LAQIGEEIVAILPVPHQELYPASRCFVFDDIEAMPRMPTLSSSVVFRSFCTLRDLLLEVLALQQQVWG
jgi:hypothetical protein